jgi:hypothetical protein
MPPATARSWGERGCLPASTDLHHEPNDLHMHWGGTS